MACPVCRGEQSRPVPLRSTEVALVRCRACRLVHWGRVWASGDVKAYYHAYYTGKPVAPDAVTQKRYHAILSGFERRLGGPKRILDVGCGLGHFLAVAEARGWEASGIEVSRSAVDAVEAQKTANGWTFRMVQGTLEEAPFVPGSFEVLTLFEVLEHLSDPCKLLACAHELLTPGGLLYLTTPNFDSLPRWLLGGDWRIITPEHLCLFTPGTLRGCLSAAGFSPAWVRTKNVDVPEVWLKLRRRMAGQPQPTETGTTPQAGSAKEVPGAEGERPTTGEATQAFRHTVESSPWLRAAKVGVNGVLRLAQAGETIDALAVKKPQHAAIPAFRREVLSAVVD